LGITIHQEESIMKERFSIALVVLSLLVALVGVAAAPMASGTASLVGVDYVPNKGPVFTFRVSDSFSRGALTGTLHVAGGGTYGLHCTQVDDMTVKCNASQKISAVNVSLSWGGSTFWTYVPAAREPEVLDVEEGSATEYCYSIWDWWEFTDLEWTDFGPYCQDEPAAAGDTITYMVPDPEGSFESEQVEFYEEDVTDYCSLPVPYYGPAYYFPGCPEDFAY
jgi:hypothetical protein